MRYVPIVLFTVASVLCVLIAMHGLDYLFHGEAMMPPQAPATRPDLLAFEHTTPMGHYRELIGGSFAWVLLAHAGAGGVALLLAPILLFTAATGRSPTTHQFARDFYLASVAVASVAGLVLASSAWGGPFSRLGFAVLALAWLTSAARMTMAVSNHDGEAYDAWLLRSLALTFAGVMLRVWIPLLAASGMPFSAAYGFSAWWCWVPNLFAAELWLRGRVDPLHELARAR